jgi:hypothetical protein
VGLDPNEYRIAMARREGVKASPVRRSVPTRKEREILKAILAYLALVPYVVAWRNNSGAAILPKSKADGTGTWMPVRFGFKGLPDIGGWVRAEPWPRPLYIEVKREGRYPDAYQRAFLDKARADGCLVIVARSVDDVRRGLGLLADPPYNVGKAVYDHLRRGAP